MIFEIVMGALTCLAMFLVGFMAGMLYVDKKIGRQKGAARYNFDQIMKTHKNNGGA